MPTRKDLRVIKGGKPAEMEPPAGGRLPADVAAFTERTGRYRRLLGRSPDAETAGLVDDMEAAIDAVRRLEQSSHPEAQSRAEEYRRLIAEIDAEIVAALRGR